MGLSSRHVKAVLHLQKDMYALVPNRKLHTANLDHMLYGCKEWG